MINEDKLISVIQNTLTSAGTLLKKRRLENLEEFSRARKRDKLFLSIEKEIELHIMDRIETAFAEDKKSHQILAEFGKVHTASKYTWIIDAIDGENAFLRSDIANVTMSLTCVYGRRKMMSAGVYNPFLDLLYTATKSTDTLVNNHPVYFKATKWMKDARLLIDYSTELPAKIKKTLIELQLNNEIKRTYMLGGSISQHICLVIQGAIDGAIFWGSGGEKGNFWDIAAVQMLCNQAGIGMTDFSGKKLTMDSKVFDQIVVAHHPLHSELLNFIKKNK